MYVFYCMTGYARIFFESSNNRDYLLIPSNVHTLAANRFYFDNIICSRVRFGGKGSAYKQIKARP